MCRNVERGKLGKISVPSGKLARFSYREGETLQKATDPAGQAEPVASDHSEAGEGARCTCGRILPTLICSPR